MLTKDRPNRFHVLITQRQHLSSISRPHIFRPSIPPQPRHPPQRTTRTLRPAPQRPNTPFDGIRPPTRNALCTFPHTSRRPRQTILDPSRRICRTLGISLAHTPHHFPPSLSRRILHPPRRLLRSAYRILKPLIRILRRLSRARRVSDLANCVFGAGFDVVFYASVAFFDLVGGVGGGLAEGAGGLFGGGGGAVGGFGCFVGGFLRGVFGFVLGDDLLVFLQSFAFGGVAVFARGFGGGFGAVEVGAGFFFYGADLCPWSQLIVLGAGEGTVCVRRCRQRRIPSSAHPPRSHIQSPDIPSLLPSLLASGRQVCCRRLRLCYPRRGRSR